jgi:hypothetical protein
MKISLTALASLLLTTAMAQQTEFSASLNTGLFWFSGPSAERVSSINYSDPSKSGYTNNPYGADMGLCYGLSGTLKRITKPGILIGVDLGYETLRSKINIDRINGFTGTATYSLPATGQTFLNYDFLNAHPFVGYRFRAGAVSADLSGGIDLNYCLRTNEIGNATDATGKEYTTTRDRKTISTDPRLRAQLSVMHRNLGVYIGYSAGIANYKSGYVGGINDCTARLIRVGLSYRFGPKTPTASSK